MKPSRLLSFSTLVLLTAIWGTTWSMVRISLDGFPPLTSVALRFTVAVLLLAVWGRLTGRVVFEPEHRITPRHVAVWASQAVFNFTIPYSLVYWAEQWVPSGLVSVLFSTMPIFVVLGAWFILPEERLRPMAFFGLILGFAGIALIFSEDFSILGGPQAAFASAIFLFSPASAAVGQVVVKRWGNDLPTFSLTLLPMASGAALLGGMAWWFERDLPWDPQPAAVGAILYLALVGTALAFTLYYWLFKHVTATNLSLITYATPVVAISLGITFLDEPMTLRLLAGAALVISGVGLAVRPRPAKKG
jgi:drug/metabolite transporter (DMT)-like permease